MRSKTADTPTGTPSRCGAKSANTVSPAAKHAGCSPATTPPQPGCPPECTGGLDLDWDEQAFENYEGLGPEYGSYISQAEKRLQRKRRSRHAAAERGRTQGGGPLDPTRATGICPTSAACRQDEPPARERLRGRHDTRADARTGDHEAHRMGLARIRKCDARRLDRAPRHLRRRQPRRCSRPIARPSRSRPRR